MAELIGRGCDGFSMFIETKTKPRPQWYPDEVGDAFVICAIFSSLSLT